MPLRAAATSVARTLAASLALIGALAAPAPARAGRPDTAAGLKALIEDLLAAGKAGDAQRAEAIAKGLVLPEHAAWFRRVFGAERAPALAAEYERLLATLEKDFDAMLAQAVKENRTAVRVTALRSADDAAANGSQRRALRAMKTKVTLYSVRLSRPKDKLGDVHYYSFVHAGGAFRFVGKMRALQEGGSE